jgi:hypothetical protein
MTKLRNNMPRLSSVAFVVVAIANSAYAWSDSWIEPHPIPPLVLRSAAGDATLAIDSFRGTKLIIVHFAPWHKKSVTMLEEWLAGTKILRDEKKVIVVGVMHEQDRDRAALFVDWKDLTIPVLFDPLNISRVNRLPIVVTVDEQGFIRGVDKDFGDPDKSYDGKNKIGADWVYPKIGSENWRKGFAKSFVKKKYKPGKFVERAPVLEPTEPKVLKRRAAEGRSSSMQRELADAFMLGGTTAEIEEGMRTYSQVLQADGKDAYSFFRLGVGFLMRSASDAKQETDLKQGIESLRNAVKLKPKNEIFKSRLLQFDGDAKQTKGGVDFDGWMELARAKSQKPKK